MEYYLIIARSITYAQRMAKALDRVGVPNRIFRAPAELTEGGCAYAVRIRSTDLSRALVALRNAGVQPVQVFLQSGREFIEVKP